MHTFGGNGNPFTVQTPEGMVAKDAVGLFVDVFTDFPKIPREGHVFLHGPRGSGKSMMFRYLQPDCQQIVRNCGLKGLPFFGVYVGIKNTDLKLTELQRLDGKVASTRHASTLINEHFMVAHITEKVFETFSTLSLDGLDADSLENTKDFYNRFISLLRDCGSAKNIYEKVPSTMEECFSGMQKVANRLYRNVIGYIRRLSFESNPVPYGEPLCGYLDFLYPLLCLLRGLPYMPKGPIYLLLDDADNLTLTQTRILNTWVSSRTSANVSIKISTQLGYKSFRTITGQLIESPHDYSEVNISTLYTASPKNKYKDRIRQIVSKRLKLVGIDSCPESFFPEYPEQERRIKEIAEAIRVRWKEEGAGYRANDDAYRYARPDYIRSLGGYGKSTHTYRYAGFDQLVHLSSGIVRNFLEAAARMYSESVARYSTPIKSIEPQIQDDVVRLIADEFMFNEFDKMREDKSDETPPASEIEKLHNLIRALGGIFYKILVSDRSERRVFSIAISGQFDDDVRKILQLGTERGYFHLSSIGNKEGTGRTPLYVLSRRLAPHFKLDPTSFAGYLFITCSKLREAMSHPETLLRRIISENVEELGEIRQLELFE